ncbi:hypothetical protein [Lapillicoccus sp.]|uniref:hypothetical protein n=1 Tax=Lapillicoccus sp. TaxID=1909287 RepID=UPI003263DED7
MTDQPQGDSDGAAPPDVDHPRRPECAGDRGIYTEFGFLPSTDQVSSAYAGEQLIDAPEYRFSNPDGGEQLRIVHSPRRRLLQLGVGAEDPDDLDRITGSLERLVLTVERDDTSLSVEDPGSEVRVVDEIAPAYEQ